MDEQIPPALALFNRSSTIIIIGLACILVVMYALLVATDYNQRCNQYWISQLERNKCYYDCLYSPQPLNHSMPINLLMHYGDQNINSNNTR